MAILLRPGRYAEGPALDDRELPLGFNSAVFAFILGSQITLDVTGFAMQSPLVVLILSLSGCCLCLYARLLIKDYHEHIERNWARASLLEKKLPLVQDVLKETAAKEGQTKGTPKQRRPQVAQILHSFTLGYLCLFLLLALLALTLLLSHAAAT